MPTDIPDRGDLRFSLRLGCRIRPIERDAFPASTGYPRGIVIDGLALRDRAWLSYRLVRKCCDPPPGVTGRSTPRSGDDDALHSRGSGGVDRKTSHRGRAGQATGGRNGIDARGACLAVELV